MLFKFNSINRQGKKARVTLVFILTDETPPHDLDFKETEDANAIQHNPDLRLAQATLPDSREKVINVYVQDYSKLCKQLSRLSNVMKESYVLGDSAYKSIELEPMENTKKPVQRKIRA